MTWAENWTAAQVRAQLAKPPLPHQEPRRAKFVARDNASEEDQREVLQAAVAMLLRLQGAQTWVLLMKRANRKGDRWSGQISLPGGRAELADSDLEATAVRETTEEVGLQLTSGANTLGQLPTRRAVARGKTQPMEVTPFIFEEHTQQALNLGPEAASAFWFPLHAAAGGKLKSVHRYPQGALTFELPAWRFEGHTIWGMTYYMLDELLRRMS